MKTAKFREMNCYKMEVNLTKDEGSEMMVVGTLNKRTGDIEVAKHRDIHGCIFIATNERKIRGYVG